MANPLKDIPMRSKSEEDFRTIVCNLTGIQRDDSVFDRIREEDKRIIKSAKKAIDLQIIQEGYLYFENKK